MTGAAPRTPGPWLFLVGVAVLAGTVGLAPTTPAAPEPARTPAVASTGAPELVVDPTTWWMPAGNSTNLSAAWVGPSPGCSVVPLWYRWSTVSGAAEGVLLSNAGENVTYQATSSVTGVSTLVVRSAAEEACGGESSAEVEGAFANVTVVAPISLGNVSAEPNPIEPGGTASVEGWVAGGEPPYSLDVHWGDGTSTIVPWPRAGAFEVAHVFVAGLFRPTVAVSDAVGDGSSVAVVAPLVVNGSFAVAISARYWAVDVGVPVAFSARVLDEPNASSSGWTCSTPSGDTPRSEATGANFSCAFSDVGSGDVLYEVLPPVPTPSESAEWTEEVEPLPTLTALSDNRSAEVGQPCLVGFEISGGVPPFRLDWSELGTSATGSIESPTDGRLYLPLAPGTPGALSIDARLVDADGAVTGNSTVLLAVAPALNASTTLRASNVSGLPELVLSGGVRAGAPPFDWTIVPALPPENTTSLGGTLPTLGSFAWQASFDDEGTVGVAVVVVDSLGGYFEASLGAEPVPALALAVELPPPDPATPGNASVEIDISGGWSPFAVSINASAVGAGTRVLPDDGRFLFSLGFGHGGTFSFRLSVVDELGIERNFTGALAVFPPPPTSTPSSGDPTPGSVAAVLALGAVAMAAGTGGYLLWRQRRRARALRPVPPAVDATAVLRAIIEPAEGAERASVELLADEAGLPLEEAHAAVDRLLAEGTLLSEIDGEGTELLSWSGRAP